ncbi:MAG: PqiC family protein [Candidatus Binataceae bacterium]
MRRKPRWLPSLLIAGLIGLSACGNILQPRPNHSRFYVLTPIMSPERAASATRSSPSIVIGLGPISMPPYLDREEMVTRAGPNQINISNRDFWAEPLKKGFSGTLATDFSELLPGAQIVAFPWFSSTGIDYTVSVSVLRFEGETNGTALLIAKWALKNGRSGRLLYPGQSKIVEPIGPNQNQATALSRALNAMSRQIADAIITVRQPA